MLFKGLTHIRACTLVFFLLFFSLIIAERAHATADFSLTPTSAGLGLTQGGAGAATTVSIVPSGGFTGNVTLTNSTLAGGLTISYGTDPTSATSAITFTASSSAALGSSAITITGTSGSLVHTMVINVYVVGTKAFSIHGTGTDGTQTIGSTDNNFTMVSSFPGNSTTPVQTGSPYVTTESGNWPYPGVWLADAPGFCDWISPQQSYTPRHRIPQDIIFTSRSLTSTDLTRVPRSLPETTRPMIMSRCTSTASSRSQTQVGTTPPRHLQ